MGDSALVVGGARSSALQTSSDTPSRDTTSSTRPRICILAGLKAGFSECVGNPSPKLRFDFGLKLSERSTLREEFVKVDIIAVKLEPFIALTCSFWIER